jgi:hypothetical protein
LSAGTAHQPFIGCPGKGSNSGAPRLSHVLLAESQHQAILVQAGEHVGEPGRRRIAKHLPTLTPGKAGTTFSNRWTSSGGDFFHTMVRR